MENNLYKVCECEPGGGATVTREVIAGIAGIAACEVAGVDSLNNNITRDNVSRLSSKNLAAGIRISNADEGVALSVSLVVKTGYPIRAVCKKVQENIKAAVEGMTGINVNSVDIEIINIKVEK